MSVLDAKGFIDRLGRQLGADSDVSLSEKIGVPYQTIASWKKRNSIPAKEIIRLSIESGTSIDWLLFGEARSSVRDRAYSLAVREALYQSLLPKTTLNYLLNKISVTNEAILFRVANLVEQNKCSEDEALSIIETDLSETIRKLEAGEIAVARLDMRSAPGTIPDED